MIRFYCTGTISCMYYIIHDVRYNAKVSTEYCILSYLKVLYNIIVTRLHTEFIMLEWILPFMNVHCTTIQYSDTVFYHWQMVLSCISVHNKVKKICTVFIIHECILSLKKVLFINTVQFFCYSWNFFIIHELFYYSWIFFIIHDFFMIFFYYSWSYKNKITMLSFMFVLDHSWRYNQHWFCIMHKSKMMQ